MTIICFCVSSFSCHFSAQIYLVKNISLCSLGIFQDTLKMNNVDSCISVAVMKAG